MSLRTFADGHLVEVWDDEARQVRWVERGTWRSRPYAEGEAAPVNTSVARATLTPEVPRAAA